LPDKIAQLDVEETRTAFRLLNEALEGQGKKLILFIDNLVALFNCFSKKDEGQMRETLSLCPNLRIVGSSAISIESFNRNDAAFYQFFQIVSLNGLKKSETEALLRKLGESLGKMKRNRLKR
jgi:hypothetical protein